MSSLPVREITPAAEGRAARVGVPDPDCEYRDRRLSLGVVVPAIPRSAPPGVGVRSPRSAPIWRIKPFKIVRTNYVIKTVFKARNARFSSKIAIVLLLLRFSVRGFGSTLGRRHRPGVILGR